MIRLTMLCQIQLLEIHKQHPLIGVAQLGKDTSPLLSIQNEDKFDPAQEIDAMLLPHLFRRDRQNCSFEIIFVQRLGFEDLS